LRWSQRSAKRAQSIRRTTLSVDDSDIEALQFLEQHSLLQTNSPNAVDRLRLSAQMQKNPYEWLLHLPVLRIPLVRRSCGWQG
jgi:hypothetical protein